MAFTVCLRRSDRSGNTEIWAFEATSTETELVYGSLVKGGLRRESKPAMYGAQTMPKKLSGGYERFPESFSIEQIEEAKVCIAQALKGWTYFCSSSKVLQLSNRALQLMNQASAAIYLSVKSISEPPTKLPEFIFPAVEENQIACAWSW